MTLVSLPNTLVAGTPEDIVDVDQNIKAIRDVVNGLLGTDNFAAGSVNASVLVGASVIAANLGTGSVETAKIADRAVTPAKVGIIEHVSVCGTNVINGVTSGYKPLEFDTVRQETSSGMWDIAQPTRLVCPRAGMYHVGAQCAFSVLNSDTPTWWMSIFHYNGDGSGGEHIAIQGAQYDGAVIQTPPGGGAFAQADRVYYADAGDYFVPMAYYESLSGIVDIQPSTSAGTTHMGQEGWLTYLGPIA